jgi:hypothetical protein
LNDVYYNQTKRESEVILCRFVIIKW